MPPDILRSDDELEVEFQQLIHSLNALDGQALARRVPAVLSIRDATAFGEELIAFAEHLYRAVDDDDIGEIARLDHSAMGEWYARQPSGTVVVDPSVPFQPLPTTRPNPITPSEWAEIFAVPSVFEYWTERFGIDPEDLARIAFGVRFEFDDAFHGYAGDVFLVLGPTLAAPLLLRRDADGRLTNALRAEALPTNAHNRPLYRLRSAAPSAN